MILRKTHFLRIVIPILFVFVSIKSSAQLTQTIRGSVKDVVTDEVLIAATIEVVNDSNQYGVISDENGDFRLEYVSVGRYTIICSYAGYEVVRLNQIEVTSTKQIVLDLKMQEKTNQLTTAVLDMSKDKRKVRNNLVSVSGRTFSVEESQRYAGSRGDVARMAQNFAGVQGANDFRNDIIVRGNSPIGVLYRLEGVDIPNPNHFASAGTTGGPVSMLNNNVLKNSDFLTGAFPAEYANTTSAVFDLGMRAGNNEKHEFLGQMGFAGFELMAEGPISKKNKSSYLINYRYSVLGFFQTLGVEFGTGAAIPQYQDVTMKLNFPDKKGTTSFFGVGGLSSIELFQSEEDAVSNAYRGDTEDLAYNTNTGVLGLSRTQKLSSKTRLKVIAAVDAVKTVTNLDTFVFQNGKVTEYGGKYRDNSSQGKFSLNAILEHKFNAKNAVKGGVRYYDYFFKLQDSVFSSEYRFWVQPTSFSGNTSMVQAFVNHRHRFNNRLKANIGLNYSRFGLNGAHSLEPRLGAKYKVTSKYEISAGYGLHSLVSPFRVYFEEITDSAGNKRKINQDLGFTKSHHFVLSHDFFLGKNSRLKIETYYQHMFNVPMDGDTNQYYSLLNQGADFGVNFTDNLQNIGSGRNYGIEITFERFLTKGFYFLNTISLYRSFYTAKDDMEYPTVFDSKYAVNILGGKEFYFKTRTNKKGKTSKSSMTADIKFVLNGGQRHTPVNTELSGQEGEVVYYRLRTNELQYQNYARLDIRLAYKVQSQKYTQEWGLDIQNITNRDNIFSMQYDVQAQEYRTTYQTGLFPVGIYRITF